MSPLTLQPLILTPNRSELENINDKVDSKVAALMNDLSLMELRRDASREVQESQMEKEVEIMRTQLSELENRLIRFGLGSVASAAAVGLAVARLMA